MPCKRCGYCCKFIHQVIENTQGNLEWIEARGLRVVQKSGRAIEIAIPHVCNMLREDGNECMAGEFKPGPCKKYPEFLKDMKKYGFEPQKSVGPNCGYVWHDKKGCFK